MTLRKIWKPLLVVATVLVVMAGAAVLFVPNMASAAGVNLDWRGWLGGPDIDRDALLAEALGISVDELQNARENARAAAIQQAADDGLITQEQADQMILWGEGRARGPRPDNGFGGKSAEDALLAKELGITIDELRAAQQQAEAAGIQQALTEGVITQDQADRMLAGNALRSYLDQDVLLAQALGISVEDLRSGQSQGKSLTDFLTEQKMDAVTVRQAMQTARENAVQQAITDGVITQEQADQLGDRGFRFFEGGHIGPDGPGSRGGDFGPRGSRDGDFGPGQFAGHGHANRQPPQPGNAAPSN